MTTGKRIELLIRELDPTTKDGRYMRENLRRIKLFLDGIIDGTITVNNSQIANIAQSPDAFNKYETLLVSVDGQTNFSLLEVPKSDGKVAMSVNGQDMTNGIHYSVSGQSVTFNPIAANFILEAVNQFGQPDVIVFKYVV